MNAMDLLNERFSRVEAYLASEYHVRATTQLSQGFLAFGKFDGNWRLFHIDERDSAVPLGSVSIRLRIEAASALDSLQEALSIEQDRLAEAVEDAIKKVDVWLEARARR